MTKEYLREEILVNTYAITMMSKVLAAQLEERYKKKKIRSIIINLSSMVAHFATPGQANYPATKIFDDLFTKSIYYELKPKGVDVLTVRPGFVSTGINNMPVTFGKVTTADICARGILSKATSFETYGANLHEFHGLIVDFLLGKLIAKLNNL